MNRVAAVFAEVGWLVVFVLFVPVAVLVVGAPIALLIRFVLSLFHLA